jgi:hypothetical protein
MGAVDSTDVDPSTGGPGITVSNIPTDSHVKQIVVVFEGEEPPAYDPDLSLLGDLVRGIFGRHLSYETIYFPIIDPDPDATHRHQVQKSVEAQLGDQPFERLVLESKLGAVSTNLLREYVDIRIASAPDGYTGGLVGHKDESVKYWLRMKDLLDGPLDDAILEAKIHARSVEDFRAFAGAMGNVVKALPFTGGEGRNAEYWSHVVHTLDAPLDDASAVRHQEYLWTLGGDSEEIAEQQSVVDGLQDRIDDDQALLAELPSSDGRTADEREAGEPVHPPYARMEELKREVAKLRDDLWVEKELLDDLKKK